MIKKIFTLSILAFIGLAMSSDKEAYEIYSSKGKETSYEKMLKDAEDADVVFFGESHNNPISHWLEYELAADLAKAKGRNLVLGAEMFEADEQTLLDEYVSGMISKKQFDDQARLWKNYPTDYSPLLTVAVENNLKFIATNIPRRYAALVNSKGFSILDSVSVEAKNWIAPLPIAYDTSVACYKKMLEMGGGHGMKSMENLPKAQAAKDATMAYFISKNLKKGQTFLHFNGSYHSDNYEGIVWHLKRLRPELKIMTITTIEQKSAQKLEAENENVADYIVITNSNLTKTY